MFTPEFRDALAGIVRDVVVQELQQFCHDFGNDLERALTVAFEPCLTLLKTIDRNQNIVSDTNDTVVKALNAVQAAVVGKLESPDPADYWKRDTDDDTDD